ncbi:MAG: hypothetical protein COZ95_08805, partial [Nitrospirae bacterium CG_4_8_14_3_um_filter_50_41]
MLLSRFGTSQIITSPRTGLPRLNPLQKPDVSDNVRPIQCLKRGRPLMTKKKTLYLIDGSSYIYRAFFAIRNLRNSKGLPTNAIYGFTR